MKYLSLTYLQYENSHFLIKQLNLMQVHQMNIPKQSSMGLVAFVSYIFQILISYFLPFSAQTFSERRWDTSGLVCLFQFQQLGRRM